MSTEHEARARRAKAVALATVLNDCPSITTPADVHVLTPAAWELAAQAATARNLLGNGRTVHPPHSAETVAAVERELRIMQVEQRVDVEHPATDAGRPGQPTSTNRGSWTDEEIDAEVAKCTNPNDAPKLRALLENPAVTGPRRATDSQGYKSQMQKLDPETARAFAAFAGADR